MKSTSFKQVNKVLGPGNNANTDQLPVAVSFHPDNGGVPTVISKFKLSEEELERVKETGEIWIGIMGTTMPPIRPMIFDPFDEIGFKAVELD